MSRKDVFAALAFIACVIPAGSVLAQANVIENQSNSIFVDAVAGSDINPGTATRPTQTIQAAVDKAVTLASSGIGSRVIIAPGTYHETLNITSDSNASISIEASTPGATIIDAADPLTNWFKSSASVFTYAWKDTVSGCPLPANWYHGMPPIVQANEMVFVNGSLMTQVMSASQLRPGTFYVVKSNDQVQLDPPIGADMAAAKVEIASRRSTLNVAGTRNVTFRGLTFEHGASCMNTSSATVNSSSYVTFDGDVADWNNWGGIGISGSTNVTVENTHASYNGGPGLSGFQDTNSHWNNNETDYNNWRGNMVGLYDFAQGGTKIMHARTATVSGQRSYYNASQGLWFDTDNQNVTITGAKLAGNLVGNLQLEASQGPFLVENSTFCSGSGIQILNSEKITFSGNVLYNMGGFTSFQNGNLFLAGDPAGRTFVNWTTGVFTRTFTTSMKLEHNTFIAVGSREYVFNTYTSGSQWSKFIDSLTSNDNHWYNASRSSDFGIPGGHSTTLSGWRGVSHQDGGSSWSSGSAYCGGPSSTFADFQLLAHNAASYVSSYGMSGGKVSIPLQLRSFGYGPVRLSVAGLPSGVSGSFSNSYLTSGNTVLTLHASSSAAYQTALVTIFGVSGNRVHTLTLKVAIRP